jgi:hypothetical protein
VRIKVVIPSTDRRLVKWTTWGRKHCQPGVFEGMIKANGARYKTRYIFFGVIKPEPLPGGRLYREGAQRRAEVLSP